MINLFLIVVEQSDTESVNKYLQEMYERLCYIDHFWM